MTGMEGRLPEELIELIFVAFADELPLKKLLRLRLVSKSYDARIMCEHIFPRATFDYQIVHCKDRDTVFKWLRWHYHHASRRRRTMSIFKYFVREYLRFHSRHQRHNQETDLLDAKKVADTLLQLYADQLILVSTQDIKIRMPYDRPWARKPLLWWMQRHSSRRLIVQDGYSQCVSASIACALGDLSLATSLLTCRTETALHQRLIGLPIQAAIRFGQTDVVKHLLLTRDTNLRPFFKWSVLDDAVRGPQPGILDVLLDCNLSWQQQGGETPTRGLFLNRDQVYSHPDSEEAVLHNALRFALRSAAIVRNTDAIDTLLTKLGRSTPQAIQEDLLFAACLGNDTGYDLARFLFTRFPALDPNFTCKVCTKIYHIDTLSSSEQTPLDLALRAGDTPLAQLLVEHGASYKDHKCWRAAFGYALIKGCARSLEWLEQVCGSELNQVPSFVNLAVRSGDVRAVHFSLRQICRSGVPEDPGTQAEALGMAYCDGTDSVVELLRQHGFDNGKSRARMHVWAAKGNDRKPLETDTPYS